MSDNIEYEDEELNIKEEYEVSDIIEEFVVPEDLTDTDVDSDEITVLEEIIDEEGNDEDTNVEVIFEDNVDSSSNDSPEIENDEVTEIANDKSEDLYHCNLCDVHFIGPVERHLEIYHPNKSVLYEKNERFDLLTTNGRENVSTYLNEDPISIKEEYDSECELYQVERLDEMEEDRLSDTVETESIKSDYETNLSVAEESAKIPKPKKLFNCNLCPMVFPFSRLLTIHMKNHTKEGSSELASYSSKYYKYVKVKRECKECELIFENRQEQLKHMKTHHIPLKKPKKKIVKSTPKPSVEVSCEVCKTIFNSSKNLKLHMRIHNPIKTKTIEEAIGPGGSKIVDDCSQFFCEICNKSFDERLLAAHRNMHQNSPDYVCGICNRSLENKASYDMHMNLHFGEEEQTHWKSRLPQRTNPKLKFMCSFCGRAFARPHEKVKHERVHTGEKPHECEVCGKSFRVSYSLTLHLRTHSDLRPFVCPHCHKRFKSYTVYNHHLRTHSDERPFQCPFCPKAFKTGVQLAGHKNGHTKPFSCTECNRPFSSLYSVKIHMKTHNKTNKSNQNLKHACCICGAVYARIFALRSHMKDIHNSELPGYRGLATDSSAKKTTDTSLVLSENSFVKTEISNDALLQGEEVSNFQTEEIVTDWMIK